MITGTTAESWSITRYPIDLKPERIFLALLSSLKAQGILPQLEQTGVRLSEDTCILLSPMLGPEIKTMMTNSAKYAYYAPGLLERQVIFGSLEECVSSALAGKVIRRQEIWTS